MVIHPCLFTEGTYGNTPYKCKLTNNACTAQFFCQQEKYWRPTYKIKCPNFQEMQKEEQPSDKISEEKVNNE